MWRFLSNYTTSYYTLVLCGVVHMCHFEGSLECIYMVILDLFIHFGFEDGSGPVSRMTDQRLLFSNHCGILGIHLEFEQTLFTLYIPY